MKVEADEAKNCLSQTDFPRRSLRSIVRRVFFGAAGAREQKHRIFRQPKRFLLTFSLKKVRSEYYCTKFQLFEICRLKVSLLKNRISINSILVFFLDFFFNHFTLFFFFNKRFFTRFSVRFGQFAQLNGFAM